jgi:hypothetical protein
VLNVTPGYRPRLVDSTVARLLNAFPAVMLTGSRAVGKTTTAAQVADTIVRLDRPGESTAFAADPDAALRRLHGLVVLDEWQDVPAVLGAVKRAVDDDPSPRRFLLTGRVSAPLDHRMWPATGRIVDVAMWPVTEAERRGQLTPGRWLTKALAGGGISLPGGEGTEDLPGYLALALRGAYPELAYREGGDRERREWLEAYVRQLLARDAGGRDVDRLGRYFTALAACTATTPSDTTLAQAAGVNRATAGTYERLLSDLFVLRRVPAWSTSRISRLSRASKVHLADASLVATATGSTTEDLMRDGDLLGRVLETFVVSQVAPVLELLDPPARLFHLRDQGGRHEVDLVIERGRRVVGLEVKATAAPTLRDARHLLWLRDELGDGFGAGVVLHTGTRAFEMAERIAAVPVSMLWA